MHVEMFHVEYAVTSYTTPTYLPSELQLEGTIKRHLCSLLFPPLLFTLMLLLNGT